MNDEMKTWNMSPGMLNREVEQAFLKLGELTKEQDITWQKHETGTYSFTTRDVDGYTVKLGLQDGEINATITNTHTPDGEDKVVGVVSETHPPNPVVRAKLAGSAFTLLKIAEHYTQFSDLHH